MPKTKLKSTPDQTPESPRKTPRTTPVTTPVKGQGAGIRGGRSRGDSASPSPVRRIKPAFKLDEAPTTDVSEIAAPKKSTTEPIFANKLTLKKKSIDDRVEEKVAEEPEKAETKGKKTKTKKTKSKSKENEKKTKTKSETKSETKEEVKPEAKNEPKTEPEVKTEKVEKKEEVKEEPLVSGERTVCDSPHRIVFKKERKPKQPNTKKDQIQKSKKKGKKIHEDDDKLYNNGVRITDFFEIRRSSRKPAKVIEEEKNALWKTYLKEERIDGLEIRDVPLKGRGIFSTRKFFQGEFVVEYAGDLITPKEAEVRDAKYSANTDKYGSYMYYFVHKGTKWCIDATIESGKYGRLLNHSRVTPNCATKILEVNGEPRLIIYAKKDIPADIELLYDYGDRGKLSLQAHPWLAL